jgi:hypothetical protein
MPYPNEHSARLASPGQFREFRRQALPGVTGIDAVYGIKIADGKRTSQIQALRFDKKRWTADEARRWLAAHKQFKVILFEPAKEAET